MFRANDGLGGYELWKSDGTETGTVRVKDLILGAQGSDARSLTNVDGVLYFVADNGVNVRNIWKSDGTEAGTLEVKNFQFSSGPNPLTPLYLTNVSGTLYFRCYDAAGGQELWKSNGTELGTVRVKDVRPGVEESRPRNLMNVGGVLYFSANNGLVGEELWRSDGTEAGTILVKNIYASTYGEFGSAPQNFTNVGGTLYFSATTLLTGNELWKSDGTAAGTVRVKDIAPGQTSSNPSSLTNVLGTLYFGATTAARGFQLWKSDGTDAGTVAVEDFETAIGWHSPGPIVATVDRAFVLANTDSYGQEIWVASLFDPGDYDRNGLVQQADHIFWATNFGATTAPGLQADGNGDGVVDAADYNIWRNNFTPPPATVAVASTAVSALAPTPPLARDLALPSQKKAGPIANSPERRTDLLLSARDAAFAELGTEEKPSPLAIAKSPPRRAPRALSSAVVANLRFASAATFKP